MHTIILPDDNSLREQLESLAVIIQATRAIAMGPFVVGYHVEFDLANLAHHARRLGVKWPTIDNRKYGNRDVIDLHKIIADDECEHIISRSLVSACRVYGVDVPEDDVRGADVATLYAAGDWEGIKRHCQRDVERTLGLGRVLRALPERYIALDLETVADPRMVEFYGDVKLGNVKDPDKVAKALAEKRAAQADRAALDPWASVPVVWCFALDHDEDEVEASPSSAFDAFLSMAVSDSVNAR